MSDVTFLNGNEKECMFVRPRFWAPTCSIFAHVWSHQVNVSPSVGKLLEINSLREFMVNFLCANLN